MYSVPFIANLMRGGSLPFAVFLKKSIQYGGFSQNCTTVLWPLATMVHVSFLLPKSFGTGDREHAVLAAGEEMRRLPEVGTARLDAVVGTDRNVDDLRLVAIEVAEQQRVGAVLQRSPAFERRVDRTAGVADGFGEHAARRRLHLRLAVANEYKTSRDHGGCHGHGA